MKWSKKDISKLSYYTRNFNNKITALSKNPQYRDVTLPEYVSYQTLKKQIQSRQNFNSMINYLSGINKAQFTNIKKVDNVNLLQGEYNLLTRNRRRLRTYLSNEYERYFEPEPKSRLFSRTNGKYGIYVL